MRPYLLATIAGIGLTIAIAMVCAGCVCVAVYAPAAHRASLYAHDQTATNMTINQDIPVTAQVAHKLSGVLGAQIEGNTVKGIESVKGVGLEKGK